MAERIPEGHIKVWPKSKAARKSMRHPVSGPFRDDDEGAYWLEDQFTFRRIEDGDILTEQPARAAKTADEAEDAKEPAKPDAARPSDKQQMQPSPPAKR